ncbi:hypothetical protein DEO72_LG11g169 [Vigna unguiculata]|uniref:Uncharacterized protein n=1 Tax=Vigna unguiculata TaxID=3917 RepID=A0A4D6NHN8_VIGUN|nr:hypothetical protein DEO72_LG11g169 [Vigna unguiculata]
MAWWWSQTRVQAGVEDRSNLARVRLQVQTALSVTRWLPWRLAVVMICRHHGLLFDAVPSHQGHRLHKPSPVVLLARSSSSPTQDDDHSPNQENGCRIPILPRLICLGWPKTEAYNGAVAFLQLEPSFRPRFSKYSKPKSGIGPGSLKTGAKEGYRPRSSRTRSQKVAGSPDSVERDAVASMEVGRGYGSLQICRHHGLLFDAVPSHQGHRLHKPSPVVLLARSSSSPTQDDDHSPNQENGVPCFTSPVNLTSPSCLRRKKLFAITPTFALPDESQL